MPARSQVKDFLLDPGIIAVIRFDSSEPVMAACEALLAGGVRAFEITLTTPDALAAIRQVSQRFATQAVTGAGSVTSAEMTRASIEAGAQFIVSPVMKPEIAQAAKAAGKIVILGACTPTEAQLAHEAGADFVKLFPMESFGPGYIKALRGPLPHLKIIPTGGVTVENAAEFLAAGCVALGVGSSLVSPKILRDGDWAELTRRAKEFVEAVSRCRRP